MMKLVIGLGNPGKEYAGTRHNAGWDAVTLAAGGDTAFHEKADFKAQIASVGTGQEKVLYARPLTFMNLSGEAVSAIAHYYKVEPSDILIVQDELDFPEGRIGFTFGAGPGGHNGITSIQERLGTKEFPRLRIGIDRPAPPMDPADYVLAKPTSALPFQKAADAIHDWIALGTERAMNQWNQL